MYSPSPAPSEASTSFVPTASSLRRRHHPILPFHKAILREIASPAEDDLLVLAKGLGLRRIITNLLKLYDGERNLVLLINATEGDEQGLGEELSTMGVRKPGLRVVGYDYQAKQRRELYESGGLISVTSRILVVDLLTSNIPTALITGLVVLHGERVTPTSLEAFIVRLYRQVNRKGFLKAFSDEPESFSYGLSPLAGVLKTLCMRRVHLWPRFHEKVHESLGQRKADVIELYQPLTPLMSEIQSAIVECMQATLNELRRSNANLDIDDFTVENALFRNFDRIVRGQLDPVWHRVGPKTKKLVADLAELRKLLTCLLSYDAVMFNSYLDTVIASNSTARGGGKQNQSPWLFLDAANVLFHAAKKRIYTKEPEPLTTTTLRTPAPGATEDGTEEEWEALRSSETSSSSCSSRTAAATRDRRRSTWPKGIHPVLEEQPKWLLLSEVLEEIENEVIYGTAAKKPDADGGDSNSSVLVMCNSERNCTQLREYLATMETSGTDESNKPGRAMMERYLRNYLYWKANLRGDQAAASAAVRGANSDAPAREGGANGNGYARGGRPPPNKRRRVRGGAFAGISSSTERNKNKRPDGEREIAGERELVRESEEMADLVRSGQAFNDFADDADDDEELKEISALPSEAAASMLLPSKQATTTDSFDTDAYDEYFGLVPLEDTIIVRPYGGDDDELVLQELRPRYVVMYDPDPSFVRRLEVYRSSNPGIPVKVYFMLYSDSVEEQRYLAGLRKEKDAFERLIREKATMLLPITGDPRAPPIYESRARTVSTRNAGGGVASSEPPRVIVDMREFRSTLPSLLHAADIQVVPATLQVGDYIIAPTMCVERKSVPDLIQSFNSGRLYTQCEAMSIHYAQPILLIEFEENKSFQLQTIVDTRQQNLAGGGKTSQRPGEAAAAAAAPQSEAIDPLSVQSKLVLLTLTFPRLRIIWSSSAYATVDIIADLKINHPEPDAEKAIIVGADGEENGGVDLGTGGEGTSALYNQIPTELLRTIPGISSRNWKLVAGRVNNIRELCAIGGDADDDEQGRRKMGEVVGGGDGGKAAWDFINKSVRV